MLRRIRQGNWPCTSIRWKFESSRSLNLAKKGEYPRKLYGFGQIQHESDEAEIPLAEHGDSLSVCETEAKTGEVSEH